MFCRNLAIRQKKLNQSLVLYKNARISNVSINQILPNDLRMKYYCEK